MCGEGAIPHNKHRPSTLVGLRHLEKDLHASFRTGPIFEACDDLLQTGGGRAYSAEEKKHKARDVVRIVLASVPLCSPTSRGCCSWLRLLPWS